MQDASDGYTSLSYNLEKINNTKNIQDIIAKSDLK